MMQIFLVLELQQHGLVAHTMEFVRVVLGGLVLPTTLWKGPEAPGLRQKVLYWGEKVGCIKGIEGLYRIGAGSLGVKFLNADLGWWLLMAPQWPSN